MQARKHSTGLHGRGSRGESMHLLEGDFSAIQTAENNSSAFRA